MLHALPVQRGRVVHAPQLRRRERVAAQPVRGSGGGGGGGGGEVEDGVELRCQRVRIRVQRELVLCGGEGVRRRSSQAAPLLSPNCVFKMLH
jgi:hypothetical protein